MTGPGEHSDGWLDEAEDDYAASLGAGDERDHDDLCECSWCCSDVQEETGK